MLRRRVPPHDPTFPQPTANIPAPSLGHADPLLVWADAPPSPSSLQPDEKPGAAAMNPRSAWMVFAAASGACAAFNGVFAKLTTTELTTSIAGAVAGWLHLGEGGVVVEYMIRVMFFTLNLAFNALMWALFTRALTLHSSTTRVSILNTSSNFLLTAILGFVVFSESLPPLWFAGAAMLVVGNVVIGRRDAEEGKKEEGIEEGLMIDEIRGETVLSDRRGGELEGLIPEADGEGRKEVGITAQMI